MFLDDLSCMGLAYMPMIASKTALIWVKGAIRFGQYYYECAWSQINIAIIAELTMKMVWNIDSSKIY